MRLQAQPTRVFNFFGRYLLVEQELAALLKIAESGREPSDQRADDATSPGQAEVSRLPWNAS